MAVEKHQACSGPAESHMVSPRLIALREALGLTKAQFADAIGIDRSSYSKIEKADKPILPTTAQRIFGLYGVDMNYIYLGRVDTLPSHLATKITENLRRYSQAWASGKTRV